MKHSSHLYLAVNFWNKLINRYFWFLACLILLCSFFLRSIHLDEPNQYQFDEDMHAYTALLISQGDSRVFEWWHPPLSDTQSSYLYRLPAIEWLHPPFGKYLEALSIKLLGNTPLSWRLPSLIAGIGVIFASIILTHELTKNRCLSLATGLLLAIEPLTLAQSQIASPDILMTFWIILSGYLYYKWRFTQNILQIAIIGIGVGLALASKWPGGLLILGFLSFEITVAFLDFYQPVRNKSLTSTFLNLLQPLTKILIIIVFSALVYGISYIPALISGKSFFDVFELHQKIWEYQSTADFNHPYQSRPQEWLLGQKPIWYSYQTLPNGQIHERVAKTWPYFGLISFIIGVSSIIISCRKSFFKSPKASHYSQTTGLIFVFLLAINLWWPWLLVSRPLFIYHFTPNLPLLIIGLVSTASLIKTFYYHS